MNPRRLVFWLLATAGVAVGHVAGYALAHPDAAAREAALGGHAYLSSAAAVIVPAGVIAALAWGIASARALGLAGRLDWRRLAAAQVAVFAVQEVVERLVAGADATTVVEERGVWFGLVAQVVVAYLVFRAVDLVRTVARAVTAGAPRRVSASARLAVPVVPLGSPVPVRPVVAVGLRAPPVVGRP